MLQAELVLLQLEAWLATLQLGPAPVGLVLCGDLNCRTPLDGVLQLLSGRDLQPSRYEWVAGRGMGKRPPRRAPEVVCSAVIRRDEPCPNPALEGGGGLCWDHTCHTCGKPKDNRFASCVECQATNAGPPPPPPDGPFFDGVAALQHRCGRGGGMRNAAEEATGTAAFARLPFALSSGAPRPNGWSETRDHIFCSRNLRVAALLPPPALESVRGIPNLCWGSDHMAMVADLVWAPDEDDAPQQQQSGVTPEAAAEAAEALEEAPTAAPVKRQKSKPWPQPSSTTISAGGGAGGEAAALEPRPQRSWGDRSLRGALPSSELREFFS